MRVVRDQPMLMVLPKVPRRGLDAGQAKAAREAIVSAGVPADVQREQLELISARSVSRSGWRFVMAGEVENLAAVELLEARAPRPGKAAVLWAYMQSVIRHDTGEIVATRKELAERAGVSLAYVSQIVTILAEAHYIDRQYEGRGVRYFMNPLVATHLPGELRDRAQADAAPLLRLMEGGKVD